MKKKYHISLEKMWQFFLVCAVTLICVGGVSTYPYNLRTPCILACALGFVAVLVFRQRRVRMTLPIAFFLYTMVYMIISIAYSYAVDVTKGLAVVYVCCTLMLLVELPETLYERIICAMEIVCLVIAMSIMVSFFVEDSMTKYFGFLLNPKNNPVIQSTMWQEVHWSRSHSGFAREKAEAAFIMNVGLVVVYSRLFSGAKVRFRDGLELLIFAFALVLTGKRMLFVCPIFCGAALVLLFDRKGMILKVLPALLVSVIVIYYVLSLFPDFRTVFDRFADQETMQNLTGRTELWQLSMSMFWENPLFGMGLGAFNSYAFNSILADRSFAYGHNIYLELLGELGIVGFVLIFTALIMTFLGTIVLLKQKDLPAERRKLLIFSFSIQLICFVYGFTGNVLLYSQQIFVWYLAASIYFDVQINHQKMKASLAL
jgi:O-antigen ligase